MGNLPASTLGFGKKSDDQFDHRTGAPLGRPPHDVLVPPPRLVVPSPPNPFNALHEGIRSYQRGVSRLVGKVILVIDKQYRVYQVKILY